MNYNSGSSHLLSYIIQKATGISTEQFAKRYVFDPLEITEYEWQQDPQGIYVGGFGKMKSKDLLKLEYYVYKMDIGRGMKLYHRNG